MWIHIEQVKYYDNITEYVIDCLSNNQSRFTICSFIDKHLTYFERVCKSYFSVY